MREIAKRVSATGQHRVRTFEAAPIDTGLKNGAGDPQAYCGRGTTSPSAR